MRRSERKQRLRRITLVGSAALVGTLLAGSATAQQNPDRPVVALFDVPFYGEKANSIEPGDNASGETVTQILRRELEETGEFALLDGERLRAAVAVARDGNAACRTIECRRGVARELGADWMVTGQFSKTSSLIWYMLSQLTDVVGGRRFMDLEFELKGRRDEVAELGSSYVVRRIVTTAEKAGPALGDSVWPGPMEIAEVKQRIAAGKGPADLAGADLSGLNLAGVDFRGANLARANLSSTDLTGADLSRSNLTDARLDGAVLTKAVLDGATLRGADLRTATLRGASLAGVKAKGADLSYTDLTNANLTGAEMAGVSLAYANLTGAVLPPRAVSRAR